PKPFDPTDFADGAFALGPTLADEGDTENLDVAPVQGFDRQQRMIDSAKRRSRAQHDRSPPLREHVDIEAGTVQRYHQPTGAFDPEPPAICFRQTKRIRFDANAVDRSRLMRRDRRLKAVTLGQDTIVGEAAQACDDFRIRLAFETGLDRLPVTGVEQPG